MLLNFIKCSTHKSLADIGGSRNVLRDDCVDQALRADFVGQSGVVGEPRLVGDSQLLHAIALEIALSQVSIVSPLRFSLVPLAVSLSFTLLLMNHLALLSLVVFVLLLSPDHVDLEYERESLVSNVYKINQRASSLTCCCCWRAMSSAGIKYG
jgi:hypothetical protein